MFTSKRESKCSITSYLNYKFNYESLFKMHSVFYINLYFVNCVKKQRYLKLPPEDNWQLFQ